MASCGTAPPSPATAAMTAPVQPCQSMPMAWSSDQRPGPIMAMTNAVTAIEAQYSQPWFGLKMKNPTFQCATTMATVIRPIIPAAASGRQQARCQQQPAADFGGRGKAGLPPGQRMPMLSNHPAVPFSPPGPKNLL